MSLKVVRSSNDKDVDVDECRCRCRCRCRAKSQSIAFFVGWWRSAIWFLTSSLVYVQSVFRWSTCKPLWCYRKPSVYLPLVSECQNAIINLLVFRRLWGCDSQNASGHICYVLQDHWKTTSPVVDRICNVITFVGVSFL